MISAVGNMLNFESEKRAMTVPTDGGGANGTGTAKNETTEQEAKLQEAKEENTKVCFQPCLKLDSQNRQWLVASCQNYSLVVTFNNKRVNFVKLQKVCSIQTFCKLSFAEMLQLVETTCGKPMDNKF